MQKYLSWLLVLLSLMGFASNLPAQDEFPVVVQKPRVSVTVFTNWQLIELTYTVGYLDGYRLLRDDPRIKPENMFFGLEIDPKKGSKLVGQNERRYQNENYVDLVYYLRYINEKKGDLPIPEQTFYYVKEEPGKSLEGLEVKEVKAPAVMLRYDSVLTKGADDIMDVVDFGSFKNQEYFWKGLVVAPLVIIGLALFLVFRHPVITQKVPERVKGKKTKIATAEPAERLLPKVALALFLKKLEELKKEELYILNTRMSTDSPAEKEKADNIRRRLADGLRSLLAAHILEVRDSDTPQEIKAKVLDREESQKAKGTLAQLADSLIYLETVLYGQTEPRNNLFGDINALLKQSQNLQISGSGWRKLAAGCGGLLRRLKPWL